MLLQLVKHHTVPTARLLIVWLIVLVLAGVLLGLLGASNLPRRDVGPWPPSAVPTLPPGDYTRPDGVQLA